MTTLYAIGDSWQGGVNASPSTSSWPDLAANALGMSLDRSGALSGAMAADLAPYVYSVTPANAILGVGNNDQSWYGSDTTKRGYYADGLGALAAWLALPNKVTARGAGTFTGSWSNTLVYGIGKWSTTVNDKCSFTVSGTAVYIGMIRQSTVNSTYKIKIDGSEVAGSPFSSNGDGMQTYLGATTGYNYGSTFGPRLHSFYGLSNTSHTVEIIVASSGGAGDKVYVDWCSGDDGSRNALYLPNLCYFTSAGYTNSPGGHGSDSVVDAYNAEIASVASCFGTLIDLNSAVNKNTDLDAGGAHPSNRGSIWAAVKFCNTL